MPVYPTADLPVIRHLLTLGPAVADELLAFAEQQAQEAAVRGFGLRLELAPGEVIVNTYAPLPAPAPTPAPAPALVADTPHFARGRRKGGAA